LTRSNTCFGDASWLEYRVAVSPDSGTELRFSTRFMKPPQREPAEKINEPLAYVAVAFSSVNSLSTFSGKPQLIAIALTRSNTCFGDASWLEYRVAVSPDSGTELRFSTRFMKPPQNALILLGTT
jgi:hypothetical protein